MPDASRANVAGGQRGPSPFRDAPWRSGAAAAAPPTPDIVVGRAVHLSAPYGVYTASLPYSSLVNAETSALRSEPSRLYVR